MRNSPSHPRGVRFWKEVLPPFALGMLALAFALIPLARGNFFFYWDNAQENYPQTLFLHQQLHSGTLPQWWPAVSLGFPATAEGQAAHYHPVHVLLAWLLSPAAALMWEVGLSLAVAGLSTYLFLRQLGVRREACVLGGFCQTFGSFSLIYIRNAALHRSLCLLPLAMYYAERLAQRRRLRYALPASLVVALQFLGGHPSLAIVTLVATTTYVMTRVLNESWGKAAPLPQAVQSVGRVLLQWGGIAILGFCIAGIQVVPTLLHTDQSIRQGGLTFEYAVKSLPATLIGLGQLFFPYAYEQGDWLEKPTWWGGTFNEAPNTGVYLGALPALLAFLAIWWMRQRRDPAIPLAISFLVAVGLALGARLPFFPALWSLPGLGGMRYPSRFLGWAAFCLACLAAFGMARLLVVNRLRRKSMFVPLWVALLSTLILAAGFWVRRPEFRSGVLLSLLLFAGAFALASILLVAKRGWTRVFVLLTIVLVVGDLWLFRARANYARTVPIQSVASDPPVARLMKSEGGLFRVMTLQDYEENVFKNEELFEQLPANACTVWGIDSTDGWFSLLLKRYFAVREGLVWELRHSPDAGPNLAPFLGALNVKYVTGPPETQIRDWERVTLTEHASVWKNPAFLPRAFLVGQVVPEDLRVRPEWTERASRRLGQYRSMVADWWSRREEAQILDHILERHIDYGRTAVVAGADLPILPGLGTDSHVSQLPTDPDTMKFEVQTSTPAFLVISNSHYPGWTAAVEGRPVPIYRTNWVMQGVFVPAGKSSVVLRFVTPGFRAGAALSLLSLLAWIGIFVAARRLQRERIQSP